MTKERPRHHFRWTTRQQREAELLGALNYSASEIARVLTCDRATVLRHLSSNALQPKSPTQLANLFELYEIERDIFAVIEGNGDATMEKRMRADLRQRLAARANAMEPDKKDSLETLSDAQLCADVERLVGRKVDIENNP